MGRQLHTLVRRGAYLAVHAGVPGHQLAGQRVLNSLLQSPHALHTDLVSGGQQEVSDVARAGRRHAEQLLRSP